VTFLECHVFRGTQTRNGATRRGFRAATVQAPDKSNRFVQGLKKFRGRAFLLWSY